VRRTALSLAVAGVYVASWAYVWTHGDVLPSLNSTAEIWAFVLCLIALHVAIGYVIGSLWAVALALTPALMLIPTDEREWIPVVMVAYGLPVATCLAAGEVLRRHRERLLRAMRSGDLRRIGVPLGLSLVYVTAWAYVWSPGGDDLPSVSTTTGMWTVALCAIAVHIAIGYLIGNPWAIALAAAPALTLMPGGATGALVVVTIAEGVPIAAFITVGVLLKRHRETRFHTL
jgi:hypothetical protein